MLTKAQEDEFDTWGVLKVRSLLSAQSISRARMSVLNRFETLGLAKNGEWQLDHKARFQWPDKGYKAKDIGNKNEDVERLLDDPAVKPLANALLNNAKLDTEFFKRPQILVSLPNEGQWFMPHNGWHVDVPRLSTGQCPGVQIFILLSELEPKGGGTLAIAGSHRLLNKDGFIRSRDVVRRVRSKAPLQRFMSKPRSAINWFDAAEKTNKPASLKVVELTGSPGDAYFIDLRTLHSAAPNTSLEPRMMATHRFLRIDAAAEMAAV
ncbi:MAG: phytanoyl-CoA dioxygenase family protein [Kordiimonadaceae bacterium]|nr:phytanoyl-CoA dioxygenase family protein [Kordiimonadaceae bacterium]MBO6570604.1 phytanoyl-CoA dioxygenase family protein [Kordiimonadaceae bacterium]MBO6966538.1 phytanoyl-CoA dioxygenase family protein [Kordiimonadaceae bacterium]